MKKILFISHDASRTGAPMVLLHYLNYLNKSQSTPKLLILKGGPLEESFRKICQVIMWDTKNTSLLDRPYYKLLKRLGLDSLIHSQFCKKIANDIDFIYANTVASLDAALEIKRHKPQIKIICHVHELSISIKQYYGEEKFVKAVEHVDRFIAASQAVMSNLIGSYNINSEKIKVLFETIPTKLLVSKSAQNKILASINEPKQRLPLRVSGSGTTDWRKGFDWFLLTAFLTKKRYPDADVKFIWVGGFKNSIDYEKALYEHERLGLGSIVEITGSVRTPHDYISLTDIFFLSSREDPFPLVALEAGALGKPVICFENAGGIPEFINDSNGWKVTYGDLDTVVDIIHDQTFFTSRKELASKSASIEKTIQENYDVEVCGQKLLNYLKETCQDA